MIRTAIVAGLLGLPLLTAAPALADSGPSSSFGCAPCTAFAQDTISNYLLLPSTAANNYAALPVTTFENYAAFPTTTAGNYGSFLPNTESNYASLGSDTISNWTSLPQNTLKHLGLG